MSEQVPLSTLTTLRLGKKGLHRTWYAAVRSGAIPEHLRGFAEALREARPRMKVA